MTEIELVRGGDLATGEGLRRNPAAVYLASLAAGSRRAMIGALGSMAATLTGIEATGAQEQLGVALGYPWHLLRYQDTAALRAQLGGKYAAATVNKMLSALRRVLKEAWRLGLMGAEDYARAADIENVTGETLPAGRALSGGELDALMLACAKDPTPAGARDGAMLAIMYSCGLRRAEVAALALTDYDPETGALEIHGKRNKER
jgi:site-specific recombinase XerC